MSLTVNLHIIKRHVWLLFLAVAGVLLSGCDKTDDNPIVIGVESVSLNKTDILLMVEDTEQLVATVLPEDAANKTVVWSSDAEDVASVDASTGLVTALSVGTAKITATTEDGGYTASCTVTVVTDEEYLKGLLLEAFGKMGIAENLFSEWNWSLDNPLENWEGIHVSKSPAGYELSIDLSEQPLNGTLCDELFRLPGLTGLILYECQLSGPIPESIGEATQLIELDLGNNDFTGELPSSLGNLTDLMFLDVSGNKLTGSVPEEMRGSLYYSRFNFNPQQAGYEITGTETGDADKAALLSIRETWGAEAPQKIQDSWTETNAITDFYGVEVNGAGQVVALRLSVMNISSLPDMSTLTQLRELYLDYNNLTQFPTWVCNLTKLVDLNLGSNNLSGEIPAEIGNLTNLWVLYAYNNNLSGEIPAGIGNLTNLWVLYLYNNNLRGTIPEEVLNHPNFNNWNLTPQNDGYGFDNYPVSSEMSKVRSLNDRSAKTEAVRSARKAETEAILSARKAEIRERAVREVR